MKSAGDFLSKFHSLTPPNDAVRRHLADAIQAVSSVPVTKSQVRVDRGVAYVQVSSIAKNKIRIERRQILDHLYEKMPKSKELVRDIR